MSSKITASSEASVRKALQDQLATAVAMQTKMLRKIELHNSREPDDAAKGVLEMRLELKDKLISARLESEGMLTKQAYPAQLAELKAAEIAHEAAKARNAELKALKEGLLKGRKMPPMALKAAPKLDQSASSGSRPIASPSAPPTREPVAEEEKRAEPVAADVSSTTRIKLEPEELDVKPILNTNASSSDSSTSLPRPPDGYATWRDLYVRENLSEIAQAQARIHGPDPRTARRPHYASYGRVRIPTSSCGKCAHHGWPCLWIDPPVRPEHRSPVKVQKCILCQEHGIPCQESFGAEPYKHTNAIAAYHNAAIQLGERPGLWMGPGVEDLDILPPQWK